MAFRFLAAGDIHLGRRPARVPPDQDVSEFAPRRAWRALVQTAIAQQVDAIALTGDVVDQDNRFYEAFSDLQDGVCLRTCLSEILSEKTSLVGF